MEHPGYAIWFTGLSGAGKSTLSAEVARVLRARGMKVEVLDGDEVRTNLSKGLGFTREDRDTNIRRIAFVAKLLARNGVIAIGAAISPYKDTRDWVRTTFPSGRFVEVYAECPLSKLIHRDPKGLYRKALAGEITRFTGIDDPYEPPDRPEITVHTGEESVAAGVRRIVRSLELMGLAPESDDTEIDAEEDERIRERLRVLGRLPDAPSSMRSA
ncbi:MAG: adenylyl-sulfate kinase [Myxococcota bacterium]